MIFQFRIAPLILFRGRIIFLYVAQAWLLRLTISTLWSGKSCKKRLSGLILQAVSGLNDGAPQT
jgi:hypothetical protein